MNGNKRPLSVTILACVYIAMGTVGFVYHFTEFKAMHPFQYDIVWIELLRLIAIVCGVFILRGNDWARWLALAWMAFHVILSAFRALPEFAIHCLFCAVIAWFLFRPVAGRYFRGAGVDPT